MISEIIRSNTVLRVLWRYIRQRRILHSHRVVSRGADKLIAEYYSESRQQPEISFADCPELDGKRIIWQYWGQGFSKDAMPELVQICVDSVDRWAGDCLVVRLDDNSLEQYVRFPEYVSKAGRTHFSDLLRLALLSKWGGVWLDATVFLSAPLPERYFSMDYFVYQRDDNEGNKLYWENSWAYYYGWHRKFKVRMLNSVFFAHQDCVTIRDLLGVMLLFWREYDSVPDYFIFQIVFNQMVEQGHIISCPIESDCTPHILQQMINAEYPYMTPEDLFKVQSIHKLTYKIPGAVDKLKAIIDQHES